MLGGLGRLLGGSGRGSVGGIHATVGADISDYERKMRQADQTMKRTASSMSSELDKSAKALSGGLGGLGALVGVGGAAMLAKQLGDVVTELNAVGAESQRMSAAFVEQWGERAPAAMETLRAASHGAISDMDLMLSANRAQMLHVTDDYNELARLLEVATARGRAMGLSTQQAFNDLVTGIGRISPPILDNLGILTGGEATFEAYAASIGKAGQELTDIEKRQALVNKVLEESVDVTLDAAGQTEALAAAKDNLNRAMGEGIAEIVENSGAIETQIGIIRELTDVTRDFFDVLEGRDALGQYKDELKAAYDQGKLSAARYYELSDAVLLYRQRMAIMGKTEEETTAAIREKQDALREEIGAMTEAEIAAANLHEQQVRDAAAAFQAARGYKAAGAAASTMAAQMAAAAKVQYSPYGYQIYGSAQGSYAAVQSRVEYLQIENERRVIERQMAQARIDEAERTESALLDVQKSAADESLRFAEQQFQALRGIVESALSPTAVTAADLAATAAGTYVDKWDEYIRRIRMPESGMGADQIAEQERLFYSGQMMDQVNWEAVVSDVQRKVQEQAGREALIQEAMRQVQMAGIGASQSQVAAALGITDFAALGQEQQESLASGLTATGLAVKFSDEFKTEFEEQQGLWVQMGTSSVEWMAQGMEKGVTPQVTGLLVGLLAPRIADVLMGGRP